MNFIPKFYEQFQFKTIWHASCDTYMLHFLLVMFIPITHRPNNIIDLWSFFKLFLYIYIY